MTKPTDKIDVQVIAHPEDALPCEDDFGSDEPEEDAKMIRSIIADYEAGNDWAWCRVEVKVSIGPCPCCGNDRTHSVYLGGCSYKSEEDFMTCGYYDDMFAECLDELGYSKEKN